jgi:hypothetical protein
MKLIRLFYYNNSRILLLQILLSVGGVHGYQIIQSMLLRHQNGLVQLGQNIMKISIWIFWHKI